MVQANTGVQKHSQHHYTFSSLRHSEEGISNVIEDCIDDSQNLLDLSSFKSDSESKLLRSDVDWTSKNSIKEVSTEKLLHRSADHNTTTLT